MKKSTKDRQDLMRKILEYCKKPRTAKDVGHRFFTQQKDRTDTARRYLNEAADEGLCVKTDHTYTRVRLVRVLLNPKSKQHTKAKEKQKLREAILKFCRKIPRTATEVGKKFEMSGISAANILSNLWNLGLCTCHEKKYQRIPLKRVPL